MNAGSRDLHATLLEAHAAADHERLVRLYARAADAAERDDDIDASCFFLTQAWVFALQAGASDAASLRARLERRGRV